MSIGWLDLAATTDQPHPPSLRTARPFSLDEITAARLVELLDPSTPWNRSLWSLSTVPTLREILEATEANRAGILSDESVKRLGQLSLRLIGKEPGVPEGEKQVLNDAIKSTPRHDGLAYHTIAQLAEALGTDYLLRWAAALTANPPPQPERSARSIAAHLLDDGFSGEFLHAWWANWLYKDSTQLSLPEMCELAHRELATRPLVEFEVLIAFKNAQGRLRAFQEVG